MSIVAMTIVEVISVCSVVVSTACTVVCLACAVMCFRYMKHKAEIGARSSNQGHYVAPTRPWQRERPSPVVAARVVQPEIVRETVIEEGTVVCKKCGNDTTGPVRMELTDGRNMLVFSCASCGTETDLPV